jgi:signal transduction histidine kinase
MELSQSDVAQIGAFVRKVTKALNAEMVISETAGFLKRIGRTDRLRAVYSHAPGHWTEWKSAPDSLSVRVLDEWPGPEKKTSTAFFDPENRQAGFISIGNASEAASAVMEVIAPEIWAALLLRTAMERVQKTSISETELARATLRARDEERRHIARELHDDLGQSLAHLKLGLKWAEDQVRNKKKPSDVVRELSRSRRDVGVMLDKIRDLSHTLYPRILDTLGLTAAVKELVRQAVRVSGIRFQCTTHGKPRRLGKEIEIALYRCCQEALNNALRHANPARLRVGISFGRKEVRVTVEDDGKGFDPRSLYNSNSRMMSSGFWTVRQRMADVGGAFRVSTAFGEGTVIEMIVPYLSREAHGKGKNKSTPRG